MTRYRSFKKADAHIEQQKRGWASLDQISFDQEVLGIGEYLSEPIFFGRAFDLPPQFSWSAVADVGAGALEVKSISWPASELMNESGPAPNGRRSSRQYGGWLKDPSFELQGVWDSYIPRYFEWEFWPGYQKIASEDPIDAFPHVRKRANYWVQGSGDNYWEVTDEKYSPALSVSDYSAKCVVGGGGVTPWLVPIYPTGDFIPWHGSVSGEEQTLDSLWNWMHPTSGKAFQGYEPGGYFEIYSNPSQGRMSHSLYVFSDQDCSVELDITLWEDSIFDKYEEIPYVELKSESVSFPVPANKWTEIQHVFTLPNDMWPNRLDVTNVNNEMNGRSMFRCVGNPNTNVYIDEVYIWPNLTTNQLVPFLTIGVAEWLRDERGMYIGAVLWYKAVNGVPNAE